MLKKILYPPEIVATTDFTTTYENTNIHCKVTFTIYGKVLEVHHYCYDLPIAAQKMLLTKRGREITEAFTEVFTYYVPLAINGYFVNEDWKVFFEQVAGKGTIFKQFEDEYFPHRSWAWGVHYAYRRNENGRHELRQFCDLLGEEVEQIRKVLFFLIEIPSRNVTNILLTLRPLLPKELRPLMVRIIKQAMTVPAGKWFLQQLQNEQNFVSHADFLEGLKSIDDISLATPLADYYWNNKPLGNSTLGAYLSAIAHHFHSDYLKIIWDVFGQINHDKQGQVFQQLLARGISEREVSQQLETKLKERNSIGSVRHYLGYYEPYKDNKLRPAFSNLIDILLWSEGKIDKIYTFYPKKNAAEIKLMLPLLQHHDNTIQLTAIRNLHSIKKKEHLVQLWEGFEERSLEQQQIILRTSRSIIRKVKAPQLNQRLVELQLHEDAEIRRNTLRVLLANRYFRSRAAGFTYTKTQFLLEKEPRVRRDWVYLFVNFDHKQSANFLRLVYETDDDKDVRKNALTEAIWLEESGISRILGIIRSIYYKEGQTSWERVFKTGMFIAFVLFLLWVIGVCLWIFTMFVYHVLLLPIWELLT